MAANGKLDVNTLTRVPLTAGGFGYLEKNTALGWFAARNDIIKTTGVIPVIINDGLYRDYARQVYWKNYWTRLGKPLNAATPGTSNHGLGLAVDINNISAYSQSKLDAAMGRHGFTRDTSESWHYHHVTNNPADSGSVPINLEEEKEKEITTYELIRQNNSPDVYFSVNRIERYYVASEPILNDYKAFIAAQGQSNTVGVVNSIVSFGAIISDTTPVALTTADRNAIINGIIAGGAFTATDRAMLDDIANKGELGAALTSTVNSVNSHADANKAQIIQEIDTHGGSSLSAFTATITPVE